MVRNRDEKLNRASTDASTAVTKYSTLSELAASFAAALPASVADRAAIHEDLEDQAEAIAQHALALASLNTALDAVTARVGDALDEVVGDVVEVDAVLGPFWIRAHLPVRMMVRSVTGSLAVPLTQVMAFAVPEVADVLPSRLGSTRVTPLAETLIPLVLGEVTVILPPSANTTARFFGMFQVIVRAQAPRISRVPPTGVSAIAASRLGEALAWFHTLDEAADELWVDRDLLDIRLAHLHPSERAYLKRRLDQAEVP